MRALEQHNSTVGGQGHPVRPDRDHSPCDQEWPLQGSGSTMGTARASARPRAALGVAPPGAREVRQRRKKKGP